MAVIPTIEPGGAQMSTEPGAVRQDPNIAKIPGAILSELGQGIKEMADKFTKVQADSEALGASNDFESKKQNIIMRAEQDPDSSIGNRQKYFDELKSAQDEAAVHNTIPLFKDQWAAQNESNVLVAQQQISNGFYKKKIAEYDANFKMNIDTVTKDYVNAPMGSMEAESALLRADKTLTDFAVNTSMGKEQLGLARQEMLNQMNKEKILTDAKRDPDQFVKDAEAGRYGKKESKEVVDGMDTAARETFIRERVQKYQMQDKENSLAVKHMQDVDISRDLEESMYNKNISRSFYNTMSKNYKSKIGPTAKTDPQTYSTIMDSLSGRDGRTLSNDEKLKKIVDANSSGKLSRKDMSKLMELHIIPSQGDFDSLVDQSPKAANADKNLAYLTQKEKEESSMKSKESGIGNIIKDIKKFAGDSAEKFTETYKMFADSVNSKTGEKEYFDLMNQAKNKMNIKTRPDIISFSVAGVVMMDSKGNKAVVKPDGSVQEITNAQPFPTR